MEMSWDKLADRCQLFVDTNKGMLIQLLKEAEDELARECQIFEDIITYSAPFDTPKNEDDESWNNEQYCLLPPSFISAQSVFYNGNRLSPMDESSLSLDSANAKMTGVPSSYYIKRSNFGLKLMFDTKPTTGDIRVEYISLIGSHEVSKYFKLISGGSNLFIIETGFTTELTGFAGNSTLGNYTTMTYNSSYSEGNMFTTSTYGTFVAGDLVEIYNYHSLAPVIPSQYHKDLCDYAIAIASAKANPELHNKHLSLWLNNIEKIKNEDADKELIHQVRSEV